MSTENKSMETEIWVTSVAWDAYKHIINICLGWEMNQFCVSVHVFFRINLREAVIYVINVV